MLSTSRFGPLPCWRLSMTSMHGQHEVGRPDHVDRVDGRADQRLAQDEGELDLDERIVHPAARDDTTLEHEPVVEHRAVVGLGGAGQRAHRLGREADLVALDDAPGGDLARRHRHGDAVGVVDVGVGVGLRRSA